jgi:hypothetical protein
MHVSPTARLQPYERLRIVPVTLRVARAYVDQHHRHLPAPRGAKLAIAVRDTRGQLRGVAILGRPVSRHLDDGLSAEVTRVATDGCRNACSALYAAAARVARSLGYARLFTYTLEHEPGTSLRAAGWRQEETTRGGSWTRADSPRSAPRHAGPKRRWSTALRSHTSPDNPCA